MEEMNMRVFINRSLPILLLLFSLTACLNNTQGAGDTENLWPEIEPFETGYLGVSDLHEIYYELCGNREGMPVFIIHGGPGARVIPYYRRFFNPERFLIVLFDQRGCGRSKPFAELKQNTTQHLVEDIERLRNHLKLDKIIVFGGSWGSTLGLAYSETYPDSVSAMVLRGIYTATKSELEHYFKGVRLFFPDAHEKLQESLSSPPSPEVIYKLINGGDRNARVKYSKAWTSYEAKIAELETSDVEVERLVNLPELANMVYSLALIENYYLANGCFLEEGQLLRDADKIKDIPVTLINGRYDMICPPVSAYRLHKRLSRSKLIIVEEAGHSMSEKGIERALLKAVRDLE